jgi:hypothetical protein
MQKKTRFILLLATSTLINTEASIALSDFTTSDDGWGIGKWATETSPNGLSESNPYLRLTPNGQQPLRGIVLFNTSSPWIGNYSSKGVTAIRFDVRNQSNFGESIYLRAAIGNTRNPMGGTWFASSFSEVIAPSDGWQQVEIPIAEGTMIKSNSAMDGGFPGPETFEQVYESVYALRIISQRSRSSSIAEDHTGDVYIDNIQIIPEPQTIGILTLSSFLLLLKRNKGTHPSLRPRKHHRLLTDELDKFAGCNNECGPT